MHSVGSSATEANLAEDVKETEPRGYNGRDGKTPWPYDMLSIWNKG